MAPKLPWTEYKAYEWTMWEIIYNPVAPNTDYFYYIIR